MKKHLFIPIICLLVGTIYSSGQSLQNDITVEINALTAPASCSITRYHVTITNSDANDFNEFVMQINLNNGVCFKECLDAACTPVDGTNIFLVELGSLHPNESVSFEYNVQYSCDIIPAVPVFNPTTGNYYPLPLVDMFTCWSANSIDTLNVEYSYVMDFPFIEYNVGCAGDIDSIELRNKDEVFMRDFCYYNSGTAPLIKGSIEFIDNHAAGIQILDIQVFFNDGIIDEISLGTFQGNSFQLSPFDWPAGARMKILERVKVVDCLDTIYGNSSIEMNWGCSSPNLCTYENPDFCRTNITSNDIQRRPGIPELSITRLLPVSGSEAYCYNESTHWKFVVKNDSIGGAALVYQARITLGTYFHDIYTFLDESSITITPVPLDPTDSLIIHIPGNIPPVYLDDFIAADSSLKTPECMSLFQHPLLKITYECDSLKVGDAVIIEFDTYRCCAKDSFLLDDGTAELKFNRWTISATGRTECDYSMYSDDSWGISQNYNGNGESADHYDLILKQVFEPSVTNMHGGYSNGLPPPWYGSTQQFLIENREFLTAPFNDTNLVHVSQARLKVVFQLEQGLHILPGDLDDIRFVKNNQTWFNSGFDTSDAYVYGDAELVIYFDFDDMPDNVGPLTYVDVRNFVTGSVLLFSMTAYCTANPISSKYSINTYINPDTTSSCDECWMPLSSKGGKINVHCPGCVTPGVIIDSFTIKRINYGFQDVNDNGKIDGNGPPIAIDNSYSKFDSLAFNRAVSGDTLRAFLVAHFENGSGDIGVTYNQLMNYWHEIDSNLTRFEYLYLKQNIPFSEESVMNLVLTTVMVQINQDTLQFSFELDPAEISDIERAGNTYYYKLNLANIHNKPNVPSGYEFAPGDVYTITADFKICGNFLPPSPYGPVVEGGSKSSEISNFMYFSGEAQNINEEESLAPEVFSNQDTIAALVTDLFYLCETYDALFYFYSTESFYYPPNLSMGAACKYELNVVLANRLGGGDPSIFPYEFRPPHSHLKEVTFYVPTYPNTYIIDSVDLRTYVKDRYTNALSTFLLIPDIAFNPTDTFITLVLPDSLFRFLNENDVLYYNLHEPYILLSDGYLAHEFIVYLKVSCPVSNLGLINSRNPMVITGSIGCETSNDTLGGTMDFGPIRVPYLDLSLHKQPEYEVISQYTCMLFDIRSSLFSNTSAEHPWIYFPPIHENPSFDRILVSRCLDANCDSIVASLGTPDNNGMLSLGNPLPSNSITYFKICAAYNCLGTDSIYDLKFQWGWNCGALPSSISDSIICNMNSDTLVVHEYPASIDESEPTVSQSLSYSYCLQKEFRSCIKATGRGGTSDFEFNLDLPDYLNFHNGDIKVEFIDANGNLSDSTYTPTLDSMNTFFHTYHYDLSGFNAWMGSNEVLQLNEQLCVAVLVTPICGYTGVLPVMEFEGTSFCGLTFNIESKFDPWAYLPDADNCDPPCEQVCDFGVTCEINGDTIVTSLIGGNEPFTYSWSNLPDYTLSWLANPDPGIYVIEVKDANECEATCAIEILSCAGMRTQTQGGWGADPNGNNPGVYLHASGRFAASFPSPDYLTIGCSGGNRLRLNSADAVTDFLPCSGVPYVLSPGLMENPGQSYVNTFAGQLVTLTINIAFDEDIPGFGAPSINLKDMVITEGYFEGSTVQEILDMGNDVIGGCELFPSASNLNIAVSRINENFDNGTVDKGFLDCPPGGSSRFIAPGSNVQFHEGAMLRARPNPFNYSTMVDFMVPETGSTRLEIFNLMGQKVSTLFNGSAEKDKLYSIHVTSEALLNNIYFCKLINNQEVYTLKLILTK